MCRYSCIHDTGSYIHKYMYMYTLIQCTVHSLCVYHHSFIDAGPLYRDSLSPSLDIHRTVYGSTDHVCLFMHNGHECAVCVYP